MTQSIRIRTLATENRFSRRRFLSAGIQVLQAAGVASLGGAALSEAYAATTTQTAPQISAVDLGGLFLFQGAGCNVIAMHGEEGALMIDGGLAVNADALLRAVKQRTGNSRVQTLINTHWHPE